MRHKAFFIRTGFFLPAAAFALFIFMMAFGIISSAFGAGAVFYCSVYCKIGVSLLVAMITGVVLCQVIACRSKEPK
jgi:uncharacterized membrane protein YphA (DoxX/SURF4 family)